MLRILQILLFFTTSIFAQSQDLLKLKEGDLIFQETLSEQSRAIKLATKSRYTHMGILFQYGNRLKVLEAVEPVKVTDINSFIRRGQNSHFVVKRIRNSENILDSKTISKMKQYGDSFLGKKYDIYFGWSDEKIYCSELVWKIYEKIPGIQLGRLKTLKDFDLSSNRVQALMKKRYGSKIPFSEPVISPSDMFESEQLVTVLEKP